MHVLTRPPHVPFFSMILLLSLLAYEPQTCFVFSNMGVELVTFGICFYMLLFCLQSLICATALSMHIPPGGFLRSDSLTTDCEGTGPQQYKKPHDCVAGMLLWDRKSVSYLTMILHVARERGFGRSEHFCMGRHEEDYSS